MKKQYIAMAVLVVSIIILSACGNTTDESKADANKQVDLNNTGQQIDTKTDENTTEDHDDASTVGNDEVVNERTKDDYLKKLNEMEEADRYGPAQSTTVELVEQETERYEKWDRELNEIYGLLKEQLSQEKMDSLREEQREWIVHRDETAKESSLNYKGGSMESLEYVATQAELTRERCYLLVAKYMN
ncbi:lysozyme inhibitor LprI family protein [Chungangia koreensis]|uniref:Lysozyme inhibitor LprI family protein n=2 Tax=Chungangia koreensis TaxID=752657 RepID=A0ABV8X1S7_9LACT